MLKNKALTWWMIALINVCAICNIKNFPLLAEYGLSIVFFLSISAVVFFIPQALVAAELSSGWPDKGIYTWVKEGLGPKLGFLAIWLQWIGNVMWYPTILSFIASTFAYLIDPDLALNKTYMALFVFFTFWIVTFINFLGMKVSGWISSITAILGTIFPIILIISLGVLWIWMKHPIYISFNLNQLIPSFTSLNDLVLLSGVLLGLAGMEMSAVHAKDCENPKKDYPIGIFVSATFILLFSTFGSLAIAAIVPNEEIQLASGGMAAFKRLFESFKLNWAMPIVAFTTTIGALGMMSTWIAGPSRGLLATAKFGELPPFFQKQNANHMPVNILICQGVMVTLLAFVFLLMPSVNTSYWVLVALASIPYMFMYLLMFSTAIKLRYSHPNVQRVYKVPFGKIGIWIVGITGMMGALFGFLISFFPPSQFETGNILIFEAILIGTTLLFIFTPFFIHSMKKPHWKSEE